MTGLQINSLVIIGVLTFLVCLLLHKLDRYLQFVRTYLNTVEDNRKKETMALVECFSVLGEALTGKDIKQESKE